MKEWNHRWRSFSPPAVYTSATLDRPPCSAAPSTTQIPKAIHSARVKCPGMTGNTFISTNVNETRIPSPVVILTPGRLSIGQKEAQAANQPRADAIEPTSVTGTSKASPSKSPATEPAVTPRTAIWGVWKRWCTEPKLAGRSEEHTSELQSPCNLV